MKKAASTKKAARKPAKKAATKPTPKPTKPGAQASASVSAYIAKLAGEQKAIAAKVDAIITKNASGVKRVLKWNVPFYGLEGKGWFCGLAVFKHHTSLNFFRGVELRPVPPDGGVKDNRRVSYETLADIDDKQLASWVRQASAIPGWLAPPSRGGP